MNRESFANGEYYHIYNRGVDKRRIFQQSKDVERFLESMNAFNSIPPIGSLRDLSFYNGTIKHSEKDRLVEFVSYCLNPNHYHFLLKQLVDGGISEFMKRLNGGYTWYFNKKYKRSGSLFQGRFKSKLIDTNEYLLHLSVYVNLNNHVHNYSGSTAVIIRSSWDEYVNTRVPRSFCSKKIILDQFENVIEYKKFALEILPDILQRKVEQKELEKMIIE